MNSSNSSPRFSVQSLRTRITIGVLLVVVLTLWVSTFIVSVSMRSSMENTISTQQFSVVSLLADQIERDVQERTRALETIATLMQDKDLRDFQSLNNFLAGKPLLLPLFNWGLIVTDEHGRSIVSLPLEFKRSGVDYSNLDVVRKAFRNDRTMVGEALIGPSTQVPILPILTPVRDKSGKTRGLIIGLTNLNAPNFLDEISANRFGKMGGYLITEPRTRTFIAATDKTRVMKAGPKPGVNPVYDSYIDGREGSGIAKSSRGVVEISSSKRIPSTGWLMQSVLPAEEAFESIASTERQLIQFALGLTLLAAFGAWYWLRHELSPLVEAVRLIGAMKDGHIERQHLPVVRRDEIGALAEAFNGLLETIKSQEDAVAESVLHTRLKKIVSSVPGVVFQFRIAAEGGMSLPFVSDYLNEMYGDAAGTLLADWSQTTTRIHPSDQAGFFSSLEDSRGKLTPWRIDYRIQRDGRKIQWILVNALPERRDDGSTVWHGFLTDITARKETEGELRIAAASFDSGQAVFVTDADRRILRVNQAFTTLTGYDPDETIGRKPEFLRPLDHDPEQFASLYRDAETTGKWVGELPLQNRQGDVLRVWNTLSAIRDGDGQISHYVAAFTDVTERSRSGETIRKNKELMQAILNAIQESIFLLDAEDRVIAVNLTAAHRLGMEPAEMVGKDLFDLFPAGLAEDRRRRTHSVIESGKPVVDEDERAGRFFSNSFYPLYDSDGKVNAVVVVATDITSRKHLEQDLRTQARTDPLTNLFNRRHFMSLAESELARSGRYNSRLSAIMMDIDHFKRINDTRGHHTGDLVLQNLAMLISGMLRDVDIVGRLGGEEFAILLPETGGVQAMEVAERLRLAVAGSLVIPEAGLPVRYTVSVGVSSTHSGAATNVDTLLNEADQALYAAKHAGRNRARHYQPSSS